MLWLRKLCDNCVLRGQHVGCNDGCGAFWVQHCVEMAGVTGCCIGLAWCCTRTGEVHYHCRAAVRCRVTLIIKSAEHFRVTVTIKNTKHCRVTVVIRSTEHFRVTIRSTEHFRVTVTNMSLRRQRYQYVYRRFVSCQPLNSISECFPQCACRTQMCCSFGKGAQNCRP